MATTRARARCQERLGRLSESSLDCESLQREVVAELKRVIGFDRWCAVFADPNTLIPLAGLAEHDYGPSLPRVLELEYSGNDFAAMDTFAVAPRSAGSLSAETGGDLARSLRWDQVLRRIGIGDEAVVACRDAQGCWGWIKAYRDSTDRPFEEDDVELLASVAPALGSVLRRGVREADGNRPSAPRPPGVLVLNRELRLVSQTLGAQAWLESLPAARLFAAWGILPAMVYPAATRARSRAANRTHAMVRAVDGWWVMIDAAPLEGNGEGEIAVTLRAATPDETFDLLCRAYALSPREREMVVLLVSGLDTRAVAERVFISAYTVQDHLKSVFEKTGVRSRRALVAKLRP